VGGVRRPALRRAHDPAHAADDGGAGVPRARGAGHAGAADAPGALALAAPAAAALPVRARRDVPADPVAVVRGQPVRPVLLRLVPRDAGQPGAARAAAPALPARRLPVLLADGGD